jgi:DNA-binding phage protein
VSDKAWLATIRRVLHEREMTLYQLAKVTGIHRNTLYGWFDKRRRTPHRLSREAVERALGMSQ